MSEESLDRLRALGAVTLIEGYGRVTKYRHCLYEWLGVEKVELSVMAELLLRGAQTEGELRGRASRMDPISDLPALRTLLASLMTKRLVLSLTPEGRGHMVTHAFAPRELEHLRAQFSQGRGTAYSVRDEPTGRPVAAAVERPPVGAHVSSPPAGAAAMAPSSTSPATESLRRELEELRARDCPHAPRNARLLHRAAAPPRRVGRLKDALGG